MDKIIPHFLLRYGRVKLLHSEIFPILKQFGIKSGEFRRVQDLVLSVVLVCVFKSREAFCPSIKRL